MLLPETKIFITKSCSLFQPKILIPNPQSEIFQLKIYVFQVENVARQIDLQHLSFSSCFSVCLQPTSRLGAPSHGSLARKSICTRTRLWAKYLWKWTWDFLGVRTCKAMIRGGITGPIMIKCKKCTNGWSNKSVCYKILQKLKITGFPLHPGPPLLNHHVTK